jgi:SAM-dependent methyltransferase
MAGTEPSTTAAFDAFADNYESALAQGIRLSGEDSAFFAQRRIEWVGRRLLELAVRPRTVLDFGCGTGSATPFLLGLRGTERLIGTDVSRELLEIARRDHGSKCAEFISLDTPPVGQVDVAYCNGVFHHIPPPDRLQAIRYVHEALRPDGLFAFWENNPWNPGTRMVMRRIPFDRDAVTLSAPEARRLLRSVGFEILHTDFLFLFPRALRALRPLESRLARAPLGAQYVVIARKETAGMTS